MQTLLTVPFRVKGRFSSDNRTQSFSVTGGIHGMMAVFERLWLLWRKLWPEKQSPPIGMGRDKPLPEADHAQISWGLTKTSAVCFIDFCFD
jgi:hypothetical protein